MAYTALHSAVLIARESRAIGQDWSRSRSTYRARDVADMVSATAESEIAREIVARDSRAQELRAELAGHTVPSTDAELAHARALVVAGAAVAGVRARGGRVGTDDTWRRDARPVQGPARSYLPAMDPESQREATWALGHARDPRVPTVAQLGAEGVPSVVCQSGALTVRARSRRSTRGKGRACR